MLTDSMLQEDEKRTIEDFLNINDTVKRLEKDKKVLTEKVKAIFEKYNIDDPLEVNGSTLTVTESTRKTLNKTKKDMFAQKLIEMSKGYLVFSEVNIDTETVYAEMMSGQLDENFVKEFMSVAHIKTLTCK